MEIEAPEVAIKKSLEQHLIERELVDFDVLTNAIIQVENPDAIIAQLRNEITLQDETMANIATAWETYKQAITAVISARIKPLIIQVALKDIPQEVMVTRQSILELIGVLHDFERFHSEQITRNVDK